MLRGSAPWIFTAAEPEATAQCAPICIVFLDHLTLSTKSYSFAGILRSDALTLENLRELTGCREKAYGSSSLSADEHLRWQVALPDSKGQSVQQDCTGIEQRAAFRTVVRAYVGSSLKEPWML